MSGWDAYVNALLGDRSVMSGAAIYGQGSPAGLWAASSASYITQDEVQVLNDALLDNSKFDALPQTGFKIAGVKFFTVSHRPTLLLQRMAHLAH